MFSVTGKKMIRIKKWFCYSIIWRAILVFLFLFFRLLKMSLIVWFEYCKIEFGSLIFCV